MPHKRLLDDNWVSTRCVLLEQLDENQKPISVKSGEGNICASGFITNGIWDNVAGSYAPQNGIVHLYTCWHAVMGHDIRNPNTPNNHKRPRFLRVNGIGVENPNSVRGRESLIVPLYGEDDAPIWEQEPDETPHTDFNSVGVKVPKHLDAVRLSISLEAPLLERWSIGPERSDDRFFELGEDLFVCGFPYGFSVMGDDALTPVFLKRAIASRLSSEYQVSLLDAACTPVMSGGPVFSRSSGNWRLVGMYSGSIYTNPNLVNEAERKATALGTVMSFVIIKQSIRTVWKKNQ